MYTKKEFGKALLEATNGGSDEADLARWAYEVYLDHAHQLEPGLYNVIMKIVAMEGGNEFSLTEAQIRELGDDLIEK